MKLSHLWEELTPDQNRLSTIKMDLADGRVPELPYFIIDQSIVKRKLSSQLKEIDAQRLQVAVLSATYGNGKTNMLKYLKMYFQNNKYIHFTYTTANDEQTNIYLQLLQIIQNYFLSLLIDSIKQVKIHYNDAKAIIIKDGFEPISNYINILFLDHSDMELNALVSLGTGKLYSRNSFKKFNVTYFSDHERLLVLALFLNILAYNHHYLIFGLDEIEKINERSKQRFNRFLTSYRELYDFASNINGHIVLTCLTDANNLEVNPAFSSRISDKYLYNLEKISDLNDIKELVTKLNLLLGTSKTQKEIDRIANLLKKDNTITTNRALLQKTARKLFEQTKSSSINDLLKEPTYQIIYKLFMQHKDDMRKQGLLDSRISKYFFDPLEYYLTKYNGLLNGSALDKRDNKMYYDNISHNAILFLFTNNDLESLPARYTNVKTKYHPEFYVIFSPEDINLSFGFLENNKISTENIDLIDYKPEDFFVLFDLFRDKIDKQTELASIIHQVTNNIL